MEIGVYDETKIGSRYAFYVDLCNVCGIRLFSGG